MKQITECLDRAFQKKPPLNKKWRAQIMHLKDYPHPVLIVMHYHHLSLLYCIERRKPLHTWWEKPTDKRGLDAALDYLENRPST
ncbi:hypothetical protein ACQR3P_29260 [Rhodococcus sp. IEGM1300]